MIGPTERHTWEEYGKTGSNSWSGKMSISFDDSNPSAKATWSGELRAWWDEAGTLNGTFLIEVKDSTDWSASWITIYQGTARASYSSSDYIPIGPDEYWMEYFDVNWSVSLSGIQIPFSGKSYTMRVSFRPGTDVSFSSFRKDFSEYAPFYLSVQPVSSPCYSNRVNTFQANIGSEYLFSGYAEYLYAGTYLKTATPVVRSSSAPYPATGVTTEYLYWYASIPNSYVPAGYTRAFRLHVQLEVADPEDSAKTVLAAVCNYSGTLTGAAGFDSSIISLFSSVTDPSGLLAQYGFLLRGGGSSIRARFQASSLYGVTAVMRYGLGSVGSSLPVNSSVDKTVDFPVPSTGSSVDFQYQLAPSVANGNSASIVHNAFDIVNYSSPGFDALAIHRCKANGTLDDNGDHCLIEWTVVLSNLRGKNSGTLVISHPDGTSTIPINSYSGSGTPDSYTASGTLITSADTETSYTLTFRITDRLQSFERILRLSTAGVVLDILRGGKGIGFGKVAEVPEAADISPDWTLIAHKMLLGNTDMIAWIAEVERRLTQGGL